MTHPYNRAFCDTSFFFASLSPDDAHFDEAGGLLEHCREHRVTLCTTWDVISETITLLRYRASYQTAVRFLDEVKPSLFVVTYDDSIRNVAADVFKELSKDKRLSFCDAITYVLITHMLDHIPCFTFDRDFRTLGLDVRPG